jgi:hypothetical protein
MTLRFVMSPHEIKESQLAGLGPQPDDVGGDRLWPPAPGGTGLDRPFIGLFGAVWGTITSFQSIAASKNTSLAVLAPGI